MSKRRGFGSIRKLSGGRYQARHVGAGGATMTAPHTFPTKIAAEMWLTEPPARTRRQGGGDPDHVRGLRDLLACHQADGRQAHIARFFSAYGRDVDVFERRLRFDETTAGWCT